MHPLVTGLKELSNEELLTKMTELQTRLRSVMRMTNQTYAIQLRMILDDYQNEFNRRSQEAADKLAEKNKKPEKIVSTE